MSFSTVAKKLAETDKYIASIKVSSRWKTWYKNWVSTYYGVFSGPVLRLFYSRTDELKDTAVAYTDRTQLDTQVLIDKNKK
jgi:hypothetical protein